MIITMTNEIVNTIEGEYTYHHKIFLTNIRNIFLDVSNSNFKKDDVYKIQYNTFTKTLLIKVKNFNKIINLKEVKEECLFWFNDSYPEIRKLVLLPYHPTYGISELKKDNVSYSSIKQIKESYSEYNEDLDNLGFGLHIEKNLYYPVTESIEEIERMINYIKQRYWD